MSQLLENNLRLVRRVVTTNASNGSAVYLSNDRLDEEIPWEAVGSNKNFGLVYTTSSSIPSLQDDKDIDRYQEYLQQKPGMVIPNGTVLRYVDYAPGTISAMHRTISLDYGVVIEGEIECILDSGEVRQLKRGDVAIMRATMHSWRNNSKTEWCRVLFVLMAAESPVVGGQALKEDYGIGLPGIRPSS